MHGATHYSCDTTLTLCRHLLWHSLLGARSPSRQSRRALWLVLGLLGSAAALLPIALGAVTSVALLYAVSIPGAVSGALTVAAIEGVLVQQKTITLAYTTHPTLSPAPANPDPDPLPQPCPCP